MTFKDEIKKSIKFYGNKILIYSNNKSFNGFCLFKNISKTTEQYFNQPEPSPVGQLVCSTYWVWLVSDDLFNSVDYILHKKNRYERIYEKFREETGCFELVVVKEELEHESI